MTTVPRTHGKVCSSLWVSMQMVESTAAVAAHAIASASSEVRVTWVRARVRVGVGA